MKEHDISGGEGGGEGGMDPHEKILCHMRRSCGQGPYPTQHCARQISLHFFLLQQ